MTVIGISGSYGGLNMGDEAILTSAIAQLRALMPGVEIVVFSRNAEHTRRHHDVDRVVSPRDALRDEIAPEVERLDLLLLGGGGILYDTEANIYLREARIAQARGVPTFAYAIGIGPLADLQERRAVRRGLNQMAGITVREVSAKRLLEEVGVRQPITVTADPAFLLEPQPFTEEMLRREGIPRDGPLVGMSVREKGTAAPELTHAAYHRLLAHAADFITHRFGARVVFVPMERADFREAHRVLAEMALPHRAHVLRDDYRPGQVLGLMRQFEMAVGMRLHFLIFAAVSGVPLIALPYAPKVADLLDSLGLEKRTATQEDRAGCLLGDMDRVWDNREAQHERLAERVPGLQELARQTAPLAVSVLGVLPEAVAETV